MRALSQPQRKWLNAIATQASDRYPADQFLAGGCSATIRVLRDRGLITTSDSGHLALTDAGRAAWLGGTTLGAVKR